MPVTGAYTGPWALDPSPDSPLLGLARPRRSKGCEIHDVESLMDDAVVVERRFRKEMYFDVNDTVYMYLRTMVVYYTYVTG